MASLARPPVRGAIALLSVLLVGGAPLAAGQQGEGEAVGLQNPNASTPVVLYMHLNGIQDFPINTQPPHPDHAASISAGAQGHTTSCLPEVPQLPVAHQERHTYYGYSSPGYVEYEFIEAGKPRYHPERGLSFDVDLDMDAPFTVHWYLETQTGAGSEAIDPDQVPLVLPGVTVRATVRTGDEIGLGDENYNTGPVIAAGQATGTLAGPATPPDGAEHSQAGTHHVYHFAIPMEIQAAQIPQATGYNLRLDVLMDNPVCAEGMLMPDVVAMHTSEGHRPRMELSILNPIRIEYLHPQFIGKELYVHASLNSPWGNYDVDELPGGIAISIEGPAQATAVERAVFTQRHHEHNQHQKAVDVSYLWRYQQQEAPQGEYLVRLEAWNDQHTGKAAATASFSIAKDPHDNYVVGCGSLAGDTAECVTETGVQGLERKESPNPPLVVLLGLLLVTLSHVRQRR